VRELIADGAGLDDRSGERLVARDGDGGAFLTFGEYLDEYFSAAVAEFHVAGVLFVHQADEYRRAVCRCLPGTSRSACSIASITAPNGSSRGAVRVREYRWSGGLDSDHRRPLVHLTQGRPASADTGSFRAVALHGVRSGYRVSR
jgi:hypothetical protein